jgi:O-succinylbenzoate synthase
VPQLFAGAPMEHHGARFAAAALSTAVLDAELRARGRSLASHLGGVHDRVVAGVAIGLGPDTRTVCKLAAGYAAQGYERLKLKIVPGADVDVVRDVRAEVGDAIALQVDANGAYDGLDTAPLEALDDYGLQCIEQPLAADALLAHARLARRVRTAICLDETIVSARTAADAIEVGACRVVNVKAGRVGGVDEAVRVHDECYARGIPLLCGGMLSTGIGRAVDVALASLPGFTVPGDLSASDRYFAADLTEPFVLDDGYLRVPSGPGIGVDVRRDVLDACTLSREILRP